MNTAFRVGYDAQAIVAHDKGGGKGRQLRNLLGPRIHSFLGFAPGGEPVREAAVLRSGPRKYILWQQTALARAIQRARLDVFLAPYNTAPLLMPARTRLVLVLHDLIPLMRFPGVRLRLRILLALWRFQIPRAARQAHVILTVSEYSREQILKRFPGKRVLVIPCTIPAEWFERDRVVPIAERGQYVFLATSVEPHRNLDRSLRAFRRYVDGAGEGAAMLRIAGVSKHGARMQALIETHGLGAHVVVEKYLSEEDMQHRIRHASAVLMPSLMEGFGIPILEGMAAGTPVLCSNTTSMPEVGGDAVALFDPEDEAEMADALRRVLSCPATRQQMMHAGLKQAQRFHPDRIAALAEHFWTSLEAEVLGG